MTDCLFCKMDANEVPTDKIYEDDVAFVIRDIRPRAKIHCLIIPKQHIVSLEEISDNHAPLMGHLLNMVKIIAKQEGASNGYRTIINTGPDGGQEIFHLHFHVLSGGQLPGF